jgi:hypothetical protein
MTSPSPVPSVRALGAQPVERHEQQGAFGRAETAAVVGDRDADPSLGAFGGDRHPAIAVVFDGVGDQVVAPVRGRGGRYPRRQRAGFGDEDADSARAGHRREGGGRGADGGGRVDHSDVQFEPTRLDARQVEHVVDQVQQVAPGVQHMLQPALLRRGQGRIVVQRHQMREAQNAMQRRAQLMADTGQELALGPAGAFGGGLVEFELLGPPLFRLVAAGAQQVRRPAIGIAIGLAGDGYESLLAPGRRSVNTSSNGRLAAMAA